MADIVKKLLKSNVDSVEIASDLSVEELEKVIIYAADKYYNTQTPVITDALYDILIDFLKMREPKSKVLKPFDSSASDSDNLMVACITGLN